MKKKKRIVFSHLTSNISILKKLKKVYNSNKIYNNSKLFFYSISLRYQILFNN